jgi:hypothetical protein
MPTPNPRISVTLTPTVAAFLRELSELTGQSQSATVAGLLEMAAPVFQRVVVSLRAAQSIREGSVSQIVESLQAAQSRLEDQLGLMLEDADDGNRPLLEAAEGVQRRRVGGAVRPPRGRAAPAAKALSAVTTPVPLTGGSGPHRRHRKAPSKGSTGGGGGGL